MLHALEQFGFDLDALLASAGLQRGDVENPDAFPSPRACAAVFENAGRERRVSNLALQLALRTPVGANPLLDYLVVTSDSVGQGLDRLARYLRLVNPSVRLAIRRECNPVRVVDERGQTPLFTELTIALCVLRLMRETDDQFRARTSASRTPPTTSCCGAPSAHERREMASRSRHACSTCR
jgi:hypothetical protein